MTEETNTLITFRIITLEWTVAFPEKEGFAKYLFNVPEKSGLYQIYGWSETYGENALLYIGKANNLKIRLYQHFNEDSSISRQQALSIRYAVHRGLEVGENIFDLEALESILIAVHKPSMNSQNINSLKQRNEYILIQNHGERGALNIQITNSYWVNQQNEI
jgi:excinuclease UvrABC nuclease subunit